MEKERISKVKTWVLICREYRQKSGSNVWFAKCDHTLNVSYDYYEFTINMLFNEARFACHVSWDNEVSKWLMISFNQ